MRTLLVPFALSSACALLACGGGVLSEGEADFCAGRYPAAKQEFQALEPRAPSWDDPTRAEYALYRGLTHEALGDGARARVWLLRAKTLDDARPGTLRPVDASRLRLALDSLEER